MSTATVECEIMAAEPAPAPEPEPVDIEARNARVMANQGLVYRIAIGFKGRGVDLEDLVQFGNIGLMRAAERFDPGRGFQFSTFASHWIRQGIQRGISGTARPIRVPDHAQTSLAKARRRARAIRDETGTAPPLSAVLAEMGVRPSRRRCIRRAAAVADAAFGAAPADDQPMASPAASPLGAMVTAEHREQLARALALLPEHHRLVLACRYGLDGAPPRDTKATAKHLGIMRETAARWERLAVIELKRLLNVQGDLS
jgi:RNA polymerase primary sigma factor